MFPITQLAGDRGETFRFPDLVFFASFILFQLKFTEHLLGASLGKHQLSKHTKKKKISPVLEVKF